MYWYVLLYVKARAALSPKFAFEFTLEFVCALLVLFSFLVFSSGFSPQEAESVNSWMVIGFRIQEQMVPLRGGGDSGV